MNATNFWVCQRGKLSSVRSIHYAGNILRRRGAASFEYFHAKESPQSKY